MRLRLHGCTHVGPSVQVCAHLYAPTPAQVCTCVGPSVQVCTQVCGAAVPACGPAPDPGAQRFSAALGWGVHGATVGALDRSSAPHACSWRPAVPGPVGAPSVQGLCLPRPVFWGFSILRVPLGGLGGPRPPSAPSEGSTCHPGLCSRGGAVQTDRLWLPLARPALEGGAASGPGLPAPLKKGHCGNSRGWPRCRRETRRVPRRSARPAGRARPCWGPGHCSSRRWVSAS